MRENKKSERDEIKSENIGTLIRKVSYEIFLFHKKKRDTKKKCTITR